MANALLVGSATVLIAALSARLHNFSHFDVNCFARVPKLPVVQSLPLSDQPNGLHGAMLRKFSNRNRAA